MTMLIMNRTGGYIDVYAPGTFLIPDIDNFVEYMLVPDGPGQRQLIRCSTSVAANYRAACLAQSRAGFISKLSIVIEEADESYFWLEFIVDENLIKKDLVDPLLREAYELTAIFLHPGKRLGRRGMTNDDCRMNNEGILLFHIEIIATKKIERSDFLNSSFVVRHSSFLSHSKR